MKNNEFYKKYKTNALRVDKHSNEPWWQVALTGAATVLMEPLVVYKRFRRVPFTMDFYLEQMKYFLLIGVPFVLFYLWYKWQRSIKMNRGYYWVGKFEVVRKLKVFTFCYLILTPGIENKVRVSSSLFTKIREGDFVIVRRDSLWGIEQITHVKDFAARLTKPASS